MEVTSLVVVEREGDFQRVVFEYAKRRGWRFAHFPTERRWRTLIRGDPGFPDIVMARDGSVVFAVLKAEGKRPSNAQSAWLRELRQHGDAPWVNVVCWHPSDWPEVEELLR